MGEDIFKAGGGGIKAFSSWKLNDAHNLTILVKAVGTFSSSKKGGGEAKSNPKTEFPEHVFILLNSWSVIELFDTQIDHTSQVTSGKLKHLKDKKPR